MSNMPAHGHAGMQCVMQLHASGDISSVAVVYLTVVMASTFLMC
jgi:hypothetical protein